MRRGIAFRNLNNARIVTLDLQNNQLNLLPVEIGRLTGLQVLNLSGNSLYPSPPVEIGMLTGLKELDLSFNQLTSLPVEIGMLTGLGGDGAMGWAWTTTLSSHRPLRCAIEASPPSAPTFSSTRLNPSPTLRARPRLCSQWRQRRLSMGGCPPTTRLSTVTPEMTRQGCPPTMRLCCPPQTLLQQAFSPPQAFRPLLL